MASFTVFSETNKPSSSLIEYLMVLLLSLVSNAVSKLVMIDLILFYSSLFCNHSSLPLHTAIAESIVDEVNKNLH